MKLTRIELEQEAIIVSRYCEIISKLMEYASELSLIKLYTFAFLYNKTVLNNWNAYNGGNTKDVVYKCLSLLSGSFKELCQHMPFIICALDILCQSKKLIVCDNYVKYPGIIKKNASLPILAIIYKALDESKDFTDRQFLKEVMRNV